MRAERQESKDGSTTPTDRSDKTTRKAKAVVASLDRRSNLLLSQMQEEQERYDAAVRGIDEKYLSTKDRLEQKLKRLEMGLEKEQQAMEHRERVERNRMLRTLLDAVKQELLTRQHMVLQTQAQRQVQQRLQQQQQQQVRQRRTAAGTIAAGEPSADGGTPASSAAGRTRPRATRTGGAVGREMGGSMHHRVGSVQTGSTKLKDHHSYAAAAAATFSSLPSRSLQSASADPTAAGGYVSTPIAAVNPTSQFFASNNAHSNGRTQPAMSSSNGPAPPGATPSGNSPAASDSAATPVPKPLPH